MGLFGDLFDFDGDGRTDAFEAGMGFSILSSIDEGERHRKKEKFDWGSFWLFVFLNTFFSSHRYKGKKSHINGVGGFFVDLLCILCLTPVAMMLVNHYEKRDARRASRISARIRSQETVLSSTKGKRDSSPSDENTSVIRKQGTSQAKAPAQKKNKPVQNSIEKALPAGITDTKTSSTSNSSSQKRCAPVHTMPTDEERRRELAWQAQQAILERERQEKKSKEEAKKKEEDSRNRDKLRFAAKEAVSKLHVLSREQDCIAEGEEDLSICSDSPEAYCGQIYVSRLMSFDDPEQAFCVPVPGENIQYSICWGNIPEELRSILKEYCAVGGTITASTEKNWINEAEYALWISLYLA